MRFLLTIAAVAALAMLPVQSEAFDLEQALKQQYEQHDRSIRPDVRVAQKSDSMTLSEAIASVRRQYPGGRILSAETRVSGNREIHHIKVLTKDGKVKTEKIAGRSR